ncbi:hypothetical protein TRIUR3_07249 [Triticum urartu]|uniref:Uncharacterized protein n=1 Tax=Triticum urartu TaxID=4572 RepID=M8AUZ3_TRIUA|nr:hypothetical protein TRIUR3_07249 [Triticum urartu]
MASHRQEISHGEQPSTTTTARKTEELDAGRRHQQPELLRCIAGGGIEHMEGSHGEERAGQSLMLRASAAWRLRLRARSGPLAGAYRVYLRNRVCVGIFLNWLRREEDEATRGVLLCESDAV